MDRLLRLDWKLVVASALLTPNALRASAQISLYTAVDLAVRNSPEVRMAETDVQRAVAGLAAAKDAYLPALAVGSSVGYSYGFPVGQPSIYTASANSLVLSFSQPQYIRSARASLEAAQNALKDTKQKVIAEAADEYIELDANKRELAAMDQQRQYGEQLIQIEQDRLQAGFDSKMDETRAELSNAQLELRRIHLEKHAQLLRARLAHLTGLPEDGIATEGQSIPPPPVFRPGQPLTAEALQGNFGVHSAENAAQSKFAIARGDALQNYRPQASFGVQYSRYAKFNNYAEYYLRFQHNNFDAGINLTLPIFDAVQRAKARGSAADAAHAEAQAQQLRMQLSEQVLELQNSLEELAAQQKVARLQDELAREQLVSVVTQLQNGGGGNNGTQLTPRDEQMAKIEERQRYTEMIDADLQLQQAELNLLRALGRIEDWARQVPPPAP